MNQLNVQLLNVSNYYQVITDLISKYCSVTNLGVVAGLFVGVLLPVVILLLESVSENVWDHAVLLHRVINLKQVLIGIGLISITLLLWKVRNIQVPLLVTYAIGMIALTRIIVLSVTWLSDWNEDYPKGVRYQWRRTILTDQALNEKQRLKIWDACLQSISGSGDAGSTGFPNSEQFFEFFKSNYLDRGMDRFSLLRITDQHVEALFHSLRSREKDFFSFGLSELFALNHDTDDGNIKLAWTVLLEHEREHAVKNEFRTLSIFNVVKELTPHEIRPESEKTFEKLAEIICDSLWERNNGSFDEQLLKQTPWKITASHIEEESIPGCAQSHLLQAFWNKIDAIEQNRTDDTNAFKTGLKLDNLVNVLFVSADPILLGRLYELFNVLVTPPDNSDWSNFLFTRLNRKPLFGYKGRPFGSWLEKDFEGEKDLYENSRQHQENESIEIAVKSFLTLRYPIENKKFIVKIQSTLNSEAFRKLIEDPNSNISPDRIVLLNNLAETVLNHA